MFQPELAAVAWLAWTVWLLLKSSLTIFSLQNRLPLIPLFPGASPSSSNGTYGNGGVLKDSWQQSHDNVSRRAQLTETDFAATPFTYAYRADGSLAGRWTPSTTHFTAADPK